MRAAFEAISGRTTLPSWSRVVVVLAVALGLVLRILAARGGLWLDEAWSVVQAEQVHTPLGVFLSINHDNNHHLNSLWLQAVGMSASPILARAPSIIGGTLSIVVAAAIGARRSAVTAAIAAVLFAVSPILVNYGAEARGYATMVLAFLAMILVVDRWLDDPSATPPRLKIGALAAFGMLSQLTMVFGLIAIGGWICVRLLAGGWRWRAFDRSFDAMIFAVVATIAMFTIVFGAAAISSTGLQVGSDETFALPGFLRALHGLVETTIGLAFPAAWATVCAALFVTMSALSDQTLRPRIALYLLVIVGLPAMIALLHVHNSHYIRYFLVSGIGVLLLATEWLGAAIVRGRAWRWAAITACALLAGASLVRDVRLIDNARAEPALPIKAMRAASPSGATILIDNIRPMAVLRVAAAEAGYPLDIRLTCPAPPYFLLDTPHHGAFPDVVERCGAIYRGVVERHAYSLSGMNWRLYRRQAGRD